jgi:transposase
VPRAEPDDRRARQELEQRTAQTAPALLELPGCARVTAAKLLAEIGPIDRFKNDAQLARTRRRTARGKLRRDRSGTASTAAATASSTRRSTGSRSRNPGNHAGARAYLERNSRPKARAAAKRSAASNDSSPAPSSTTLKTSPALT